MSYIQTLLSNQRVFCDFTVENKKALLDDICQTFARDIPKYLKIDDLHLLDHFIQREKLGTTAIGNGVAIPHIRLQNITTPLGAFYKLHPAIPFDAGDNLNVDLVFALIVPEHYTNQHLEILSEISKVLNSSKTRTFLRSLHSPLALFNQLTTQSTHALTS